MMPISMPTPKRFTTDEYYRMVEAGILSEDDHVELIEGEIVTMTAMGSKHASCVNRLAEMLITAVAAEAQVNVQTPVRLNDFAEPEPDIALLKRSVDFYADALPGPSDVLLIVEVGDSSVAYDRDVKAPLYARAGIPELWLIDLIDEAITRYSDVRNGEYRQLLRMRRGDAIASTSLPEIELEVDAILGPRRATA